MVLEPDGTDRLHRMKSRNAPMLIRIANTCALLRLPETLLCGAGRLGFTCSSVPITVLNMPQASLHIRQKSLSSDSGSTCHVANASHHFIAVYVRGSVEVEGLH